MLLSELKRLALRGGRDHRRVVQAINPIEAHYNRVMGGKSQGELAYTRALNRLYGGFDTKPTVEWYIENVQDFSSDEVRWYVWNFGPQTKAFLDDLVDHYYTPDEIGTQHERGMETISQHHPRSYGRKYTSD